MIYGLDTASRKWHVVGEDGRFASHNVRPRVPTDEARIELADTWRAWRDWNLAPGDTVVCEEPLGLANPMTSRILAMAAGDIHLATFWPERAGAIVDPVRWVWADVAQWKRLIVGKGGADKPEIQAFVEATYGVVYDEEDHADAHCIRDFGKLMEGMDWVRPLSLKQLNGPKGLRKRDQEAAEAHDELVAAGLKHLEDWRMACNV